MLFLPSSLLQMLRNLLVSKVQDGVLFFNGLILYGKTQLLFDIFISFYSLSNFAYWALIFLKRKILAFSTRTCKTRAK